MLGTVKERLPAVDFDLFKKLIAIVSGGTCRRLILSGAEVTTFLDLETTSSSPPPSATSRPYRYRRTGED